MDVVALIHQRHKLQSGVLRLQLAEAGVDVLRCTGGGIGALLFKAEDDALIAVEAGVGFVPVVGEEHLCHILQADWLHSLNVQVKEQQVLQGVQIGNLLTHGHHVADAVLRHIARRHIEALGAENVRDGVHGQNMIQVCFAEGILAAGFQRIHAAVHLCQRGIQSGGVGSQVGHGTADFQHPGGLLLAENPHGIFELEHTAVQLGNHIQLQIVDGVIQLCQLAFQLLNLAVQQIQLNAHVGKLLAKVIHSGVDLRNLRFQVGNASVNGAGIQPPHGVLRIDGGAIRFQLGVFLAVIQGVHRRLLFLLGGFRVGINIRNGGIKCGLASLQVIGACPQVIEAVQLILQGVDSVQDVVKSIPDGIEGIQHRLQLRLGGFQLRHLVLQLGFLGNQLRLVLGQLCFGGGRGGGEGGLAAVQLLPGGVNLPLGIRQLVALLLQVIGRIVQLAVDGIENLAVHAVNFCLVKHYMELLLHRAGGGHPGNTGDALQFGHQGVVEEFRQRHGVLSLHGNGSHLHRKHGGVDFQHIGGANHTVPTGFQGGELLLNVHTDGVHVHRFLKLHHHHAVVFAGCGGHFLDVFQGGHGLLHGFGNLGLHLFRAGTGIGGHHHDVGEIHVRQQVGGHFQIGHHAQHQNGNDCNKNSQRLFDTEFWH